IEIGEIEACLLVAGATIAACVLTDNMLTAFVNADAPDTLRETLSNQLPDYMMPTRIIALDHFPRTPNGKVDRHALSVEASAVSSQPDDASPRGETEETLAEIWQDALGRGSIGRHQNFFAIGGHSLLAIRIMTTVSAILEEDVPVRVLFSNPSIAELASYIEVQVLGMPTAGYSA
ncbi:MAG: phosphopantetheine-binding protein, partial [Litoreibacter sp.]